MSHHGVSTFRGSELKPSPGRYLRQAALLLLAWGKHASKSYSKVLGPAQTHNGEWLCKLLGKKRKESFPKPLALKILRQFENSLLSTCWDNVWGHSAAWTLTWETGAATFRLFSSQLQSWVWGWALHPWFIGSFQFASWPAQRLSVLQRMAHWHCPIT